MTLSYKKCSFLGLHSKKKNPCLIGGGSYNFQPSFRGGSVRFVPKGGGGPCVIHRVSKCSGLPHRMQSPCGHLDIMNNPIIRTAAKSPAKINLQTFD